MFLLSNISKILVEKCLTGICDSYLYFKSDGSIKCGSTLDHGLTIQQTSDQCAESGAIIPELPSPNDWQMINIIRVIIYFLRYKVGCCSVVQLMKVAE